MVVMMSIGSTSGSIQCIHTSMNFVPKTLVRSMLIVMVMVILNGYDVVMIHLKKYASVNQVPKALVRSMLAFKLPRASRCCPLLRMMVLYLTS